MKAVPTLVVVLVVVAAGGSAEPAGCGASEQAATQYHCPMHPTYVSDRPGDCPICGMRLVPAETRTAPTTVPAYVCPMHPEVTSDKPGRCPKCGMDLVSPPTSADCPLAGAGAQRRRPDTPRWRSAPRASGSPACRQPAATRERVARTIRAVGTVTADETRIRHVHTKIPGWVERLYVNFTGQYVTKGEPILSIYSPELLATQEEYLRARETARRFSRPSCPRSGRAARTWSRRRAGGSSCSTSPKRSSPSSSAPARPSARSPSTPRSRASSPRRTSSRASRSSPRWSCSPSPTCRGSGSRPTSTSTRRSVLRLGQEAAVTLPYDAEHTLQGRIAYIYPTLDTDTRTLKVRFEFPNPGWRSSPACTRTSSWKSRPWRGS